MSFAYDKQEEPVWSKTIQEKTKNSSYELSQMLRTVAILRAGKMHDATNLLLYEA